MTHFKTTLTILSLVAASLTGCSSQPNSRNQNHVSGTFLNEACQPLVNANIPSTSLKGIRLVGTSITNAPFASSAAEIVSYDACSDRLYIVNAQDKKIDVLALSRDSIPTSVGQIDLQSAGKHSGIEIGAANSVSTHNGLIAVAIENKKKQRNGIIALYRSDSLDIINTFPAGALPDMVSFSKDGRYIAAANEGEPNSNYSIDPEGSITLIDLKPGLEHAIVTQIDFKDFNQGESRYSELGEDVRISGPNASVAQDLEPEYLTFADNGKLYVAMQENNAIATIDVQSASIEKIFGLGGKSWETSQLDASNKDGIIGNLHAYPMLEGLYMPDSIASYTIKGKTYIVTANEGDGREYGFDATQKQCDDDGYKWDGDDDQDASDYDTKQAFCIAYVDEVRGKDLKVASSHPLATALKDKNRLARLKIIKPQEVLAADAKVQTFGARSFSIWSELGEPVFDSGDDFARFVLAQDKANFNSTNDSNQSADNRSDDKGVEPEAIEVAVIGERAYAFIGLERQGGIMVYDVTIPTHAKFINYLNNRDFIQPVCSEVDDGDCKSGRYNPKAGDLGPESIEYFSRNGSHYIAVSNEVSGTTSVYSLTF
ncbi:choice-of-anchor I family protein [Vibrio genomosp. F10]|uniref:choice-of-anchor I family protein n=1 Tax=Vibrio genomosp. F10 TaxID=723171 RepID=UPI0002DA6CC4|nr:choice-of-anchor I family protein [Vibrio genomosp. F10]OEF05777.1 alkaline phosphatase [Vibrio genomosp. F10 str. 9ZB36]